VPDTLELNTSVDVLALLHTCWVVGVTVMIGVGSTVIVKFCTGPKQAFACGVTVNTPLVGVVPLLVAVNEVIVLPLPDVLVPIVALLLIHV